MKIIDAFPFYNEVAMLKYRLTIMYPVVDYFILVEATTTYVGNKKELYYENNKEQFKEFQDKIIHIIVDDMPKTTNPWNPENHQRKCISRGFSKIEIKDDDILIISDLDEIPNPDTVAKWKESGLPTLSYLRQSLYYYNLTVKSLNDWFHPYAVQYGQLRTQYNSDTNIMRGLRSGHPIIENGGWHMSYFGDSTFIRNKLKNFAHTECDTENNTKLENISRNVQGGKWLIENDNAVHLIRIPIHENRNLPPKYQLLISLLSTNI